MTSKEQKEAAKEFAAKWAGKGYEKGETLELDENDNIKGWTDKLTGLKTQFPNMFETASEKKHIEEKKLPGGDAGRENEPKNLAEALQQRYEMTHEQ